MNAPRRLAIVGLVALTALGALAGRYVWLNAPTPYAWNSKKAWKNCRGAIARYPHRPAPSCEAMSMCARQGRLSRAEAAKLTDMEISAGCYKP